MASSKYKPGEYFRRSVLTKSFEQSTEPSEDNSVVISRKDLDGDEPVVDKGKPLDSAKCGKGLATWKIKEDATKDASARKIEFIAKILRLSAICNNRDSPRDKTLHVKGAIFCPL